jgi:sodium-dependent dicarboxylate transporter 2/3/5
MLGIAYAASIGGIATIIGSPPNAFVVQYIHDTYGDPVSFLDWMLIGGPFVIVLLPIAWALITWALYPVRVKEIEGGRAFIEQEYRRLGPVQPGEWATFIVFLLTACAWMIRPILEKGIMGPAGETVIPAVAPWINDGVIAIAAALMLFLVPVDLRQPAFVMDWRTASRLPWGILILFGGGLSLAAAVKANGVAEFIGSHAHALAGAPPIVLVIAVTTVIIFLTELTSNTATTATMVPILGAIAPGFDVHPYLLIIPATIGASCAFMLPVATPPNAMVFAAGCVTIPQMAKAGFWLNIAGIVVITAIAYAIVLPLLIG